VTTELEFLPHFGAIEPAKEQEGNGTGQGRNEEAIIA
jgi:hypothetical protein